MTKLSGGVGAALLAALLFGLSTPFAKLLLAGVPAVLLAGLLYLGSGIGLTVIRSVRRRQDAQAAPLAKSDVPWLAGAVFFGGVVGPVFLLLGLQRTPASSAALLLNLEGVFTALLAWFVFRENFDRRIALGMGLIVGGGAVLSWPGSGRLTFPAGTLAVTAACLCWAIDNNLTQKVSAADPMLVASVKGLIAGLVNTALGLLLHPDLPRAGALGWAMLVGLVGYGLSLALFVTALRQLGTARTGAYFSLAPFLGAVASILVLHEPISWGLVVRGCPDERGDVAPPERAARARARARAAGPQPPSRPRRAPRARARGGGRRHGAAHALPRARAPRPQAPALPGHPPPALALSGRDAPASGRPFLRRALRRRR